MLALVPPHSLVLVSSVTKRTALLTALAVVVVAVAWMVWPLRSDVQWLTDSPAGKKPVLSWLGPCRIPLLRAWLRVKGAVFGPPVTIFVSGTIFEFRSLSPLLASTNVVWRRTNDTGDQVWLVAEANEWARDMERAAGAAIVTRPRLVVGEGDRAQVATFQTLPVGTAANLRNENVGWSSDLRVKGRGAPAFDPTCFLTGTEIRTRSLMISNEPAAETYVHTNFSFGARIRLMTNGGVFLLSSQTNNNGKFLGALFAPARK